MSKAESLVLDVPQKTALPLVFPAANGTLDTTTFSFFSSQFLIFLLVLRIKSRTFYMLRKCSATEPQQPSFVSKMSLSSHPLLTHRFDLKSTYKPSLLH